MMPFINIVAHHQTGAIGPPVNASRRVWSIRATASVFHFIEWDNDLPPFPVLTGDVAPAEAVLHSMRSRHKINS